MKKKNKNSSIDSSELLDIDQLEEIKEKNLELGIEIVNKNKEELEFEREERFRRFATGKTLDRDKVKYNFSAKTIILVVLFLVVVIYLLHEYGPIFGIHFRNKQYNLEDHKIELVTTDRDIYKMYNQEILVYSNNNIKTYNNKGKITWDYTFSENFTPSMYIEGKYLIITNDSTGTIFLFENKKEILNKKVDGIIKNVFMDKYGNFAVEYTNASGYTSMVSVYNKSGKNKFDIYLPQEPIVSLTLLDYATKALVVQADATAFNIGLKFKFIDTSLPEDKNIKEVASLDNQFIYDINIQGNEVYALLDDKIICIELNTGNIKEIKSFQNTQMLYVAIKYNYYTYVEKNLDSNKYIIESFNYRGNSISNMNIDALPKSFVGGNLINYYIYQDRILAVNKWGIELRDIETTFTPKQVIVFNDEKSLALIYTNKIYIIDL